MYNQFNQYNPYQMGQFQMPQYQQTSILPPQQVLQASGKSSVDAIRMSPNSSVLVMDSTAPIVWLCTSDSLGKVTSVPYDISPHQDTPIVDVPNLNERLTRLEDYINRLEAAKNEPDAGRIKSKQNGKSPKSDSAD